VVAAVVADDVVRSLRLVAVPAGYGGEVTSLTVNVFNVTNRCPVCGGAANARYHASGATVSAQMRRKCKDCGFTWDEAPMARSF
jgi:transposase-like protein